MAQACGKKIPDELYLDFKAECIRRKLSVGDLLNDMIIAGIKDKMAEFKDQDDRTINECVDLNRSNDEEAATKTDSE